MIRKEFCEVKTTDKFSQAGINSEKQMAFYLKRGFGDNPKVLILNNLRFNFNDDPAQIDHLVIHKYGMIIIESKSVTNKVTINERGEWIRHYKYDQGMASPIKQAERQANYLKKYLKLYGPKLPSGLFSQPTYDKLPIDVVVAISDSGIIKRGKGVNSDNVCKADEVPDKVHKIIDAREEDGGLLGPFTLDAETREAICTFLNEAHTPLEKGAAERMEPKSPIEVDSQKIKEPLFRCGECRGKNIDIVPGQYGYYFKCRDCKHNTPIKQICESCKGKMKIRKEQNRFFAECKGCGTSNHIFTNPG